MYISKKSSTFASDFNGIKSGSQSTDSLSCDFYRKKNGAYVSMCHFYSIFAKFVSFCCRICKLRLAK